MSKIVRIKNLFLQTILDSTIGKMGFSTFCNIYFQTFWEIFWWTVRLGNKSLVVAWAPPGFVNFEEIRTVYGGNVGPIDGNVIEEDDLSENLYRNDASVHLLIRIGYVNSSYYEDTRVVNRIIQSSNTFSIYNNISIRSQQVRRANGNVSFLYEQSRRGLGNCRKKIVKNGVLWYL